MIAFDAILGFLQKYWRFIGLISLFISALWRIKDIHRFLLRFNTYEIVEQKWLLEWLLNNTLFRNVPIQIEDMKEDKICPDCKSLIGYDNRELVQIKDIVGNDLLIIHKDCIKNTEQRVFVYENISFLLRKKVLKVAKLRNLWKMHGSNNELLVKSPNIMFVTYVEPKGLRLAITIPRNVVTMDKKKYE